MSMFKKPKRNVRQRQIDDDELSDVEMKTEDDPSLEELKSSIAKFKEKKASKSNSTKPKKPSKNIIDENGDDKKAPAQLLSFDEDLLTGGKVERGK